VARQITYGIQPGVRFGFTPTLIANGMTSLASLVS
jgi:hypothetical protein